MTASSETTTLPAKNALLKDPFLVALGERLRALRSRRGITRKALSRLADVSERHLANVESGVGNASIQFLRQLTAVLNCTLAEMIGDETASSPEWLMIREILRGRSDDELARVRNVIMGLFDAPATESARRRRIALIGLRGGGKTSLGRMLADAWMVPFIELSRHIETLAGCSIAEIHNLYGPTAYRRHERRAMEEIIQRYPRAVIATPGGIVSDPATYNMLLSHCYSVWIKASPREHMDRVIAQGDTRPMLGNSEAMADLQSILDSRAAFYSKADLAFDTSDQTLGTTFSRLVQQLQSLSPISEPVREA